MSKKKPDQGRARGFAGHPAGQAAVSVRARGGNEAAQKVHPSQLRPGVQPSKGHGFYAEHQQQQPDLHPLVLSHHE